MEKTYDIYRHPVFGYKAVKNGFSWPALFFGIFWMFYKRMWAWGFGWLLLQLLSDYMHGAADPFVHFVGLIALFALWLIPGFHGNEWVRDNLSRRGFSLEGCVISENISDALARGARKDWGRGKATKAHSPSVPVAYGDVPDSIWR